MSLLSQRSCDVWCSKQGSWSMKQPLYKRIFHQIFWLQSLMPWRVTEVQREKWQQFFQLHTEAGTAVRVDGPNSLHGTRKGISSSAFLLLPAADSSPQCSTLGLPWLQKTQVDTEPDKKPVFIKPSQLSNIVLDCPALKEVSQIVSKIFPLLSLFPMLSRSTFCHRTQKYHYFSISTGQNHNSTLTCDGLCPDLYGKTNLCFVGCAPPVGKFGSVLHQTITNKLVFWQGRFSVCSVIPQLTCFEGIRTLLFSEDLYSIQGMLGSFVKKYMHYGTWTIYPWHCFSCWLLFSCKIRRRNFI